MDKPVSYIQHIHTTIGTFMNHMQALLNDKELALEVYASIPMGTTYMRINRGWGMFYQFHWEDNKMGNGLRSPSRYIRYLNDWVPLLAMQGRWPHSVEENGVFDVFEFKLALANAFPVEVLGEKAWDIVQNRPSSGTHYNILSEKYHRMGESECTEMHSFYEGESHWLETAYQNADMSDTFIDLERLLIELQQKEIISSKNA